MNAYSTTADENNGDETSKQPRPSTRSVNRAAGGTGGSGNEPPSSSDEDDEPTSSSGSSSSSAESEGESESDSEEQGERNTNAEHSLNSPSRASPSIPHIPGRPKPRIRRVEHDTSLLSRISDFLPRMKDANEDLQREIAEGRAQDVMLDSVDDEEHEGEGQYIEMNLGLGVLEEKRGDEDGASSSSEIGADSDPDEQSGSSPDRGQKSNVYQDSNVLGRLMRSKQSNEDRPTIEEIGE